MAAYAQTVKNYTINTTAKTITFTDYTTIVLERIALITDITTGTIIYQFNSLIVTGSVSGNVLTLSAMAGVSNTDKLRIDYTNSTGDPTYETPALPLGAATSAKQPALGSATIAASTPVNIANDQILPVRGAHSEQAGLTSNATATPLVAAIDVSAYKWMSLQLTGTFVATIQFQGSNDGTNYQPIPLIATTTNAAVTTTQTGGTGIFVGPVDFRYLKVALTAYTSGNVNGTLELYHSPSALVSIGGQVSQSGTWVMTPNGTIGSTYPTTAIGIGLNDGGNTRGLAVARSANAAGDNTLPVVISPASASLGLTSFIAQALSNTVLSVKASAGRVHNYNIYNPNSTGVYVQFFDLATGSVTLGTTSPKQSFYIPPGGIMDGIWLMGVTYATAISIAATTTAAGAAAPSTGLLVNLGYI